jgi:ribose transport system substrate-binding protein
MNLKKTLVTAGTALVIPALVTACGTAQSTNTSSGKASSGKSFTIALSNSYDGNTWRTQMVDSFNKAGKMAQSSGQIANYKVVNGDNTTSTQISQMNDLILQHVSAIVLDAASSTALNGEIAKAHSAGIPVIAFDSNVTSPYAIKVEFNYAGMGAQDAQFVAQQLHGKGNVLLVRGIPGNAIDDAQYNAWMQVLKKYPGIKVVGTAYGQWADSPAQSAVSKMLPSLPKIDGVISQGGCYGIVQAFQNAGRPVPVMNGVNVGNYLQWWAKTKNYTSFSTSSSPTVGSAAFYVALAELQGKKVPNVIQMPAVTITQSNLSTWENTGANSVAGPFYTYSWVQKNLLNQK